MNFPRKIIPAIDLVNGEVVRLKQGSLLEKTEYENTPVDFGKKFLSWGFNTIQLIDISNAKAGKLQSLQSLKELAALGLQIHYGGGIRTKDDAAACFNAGAKRILLSTTVWKNRDSLEEWLSLFGRDRIILSLDLHEGKIGVDGWEKMIAMEIEPILQTKGLRHVMVTDIASDGMKKGHQNQTIHQLKERYPHLNWIAAGGIYEPKDVLDLENKGIHTLVVGKGVYEHELMIDWIASASHLGKIRFGIDSIDWSKGLIPAVLQSSIDREVLMLGYMNREALQKTLDTGYVVFFSRSRLSLWMKGETSGNRIIVDEILLDCDRDTLLLKVTPKGECCHRKTKTCF